MTDVAKRIGNRIKKARKQRGYSQSEFADKLEIGRSTLANYEQGARTPTIETVEEIATGLNVPPSYIVGWNDNEISFEGGIEMTHLPIYKTIREGHRFNKKEDIIGYINCKYNFGGTYFAFVEENTNRIVIVSEDPIEEYNPNKEVVISSLGLRGFKIVKVIKNDNGYSFVNSNGKIDTYTTEEVEILLQVRIHGYVVEITV